MDGKTVSDKVSCPLRRLGSSNTNLQPMNPTLREKCKQAIQMLMNHHYAPPFQQPVDPVSLGIPDYFEVIKRPMDLGTIARRIKDTKTAHFRTFEDFCADVRLVFSNCLTYNNAPSDEVIRTMATTLSNQFDRFAADVAANPGKYGLLPEPRSRGRPRADGTTSGNKRKRPVEQSLQDSGPGDFDSGDMDGDSDTGGKRLRKSDNIPMSNKFPFDSEEHKFWRGLELSWDDLGIGGGTRRVPVLGHSFVDLYALYHQAMKYGGYDVINGIKGGWTAMYRELTGLTSVEGSAASRIKKLYERMALEYERRIDQGWTLESARPYPVLTAKETFHDAGRGIPESIAKKRMAGVELLAQKLGTTPTIIPDAAAASERAPPQQEKQPKAPVVPQVRELRPPKLTFCSGANAIFGTGSQVRRQPPTFLAATAGSEMPPIRYTAVSQLLAANLSVSSHQLPQFLRTMVNAGPPVQDHSRITSPELLNAAALSVDKRCRGAATLLDAENTSSVSDVIPLPTEVLDGAAWLKSRIDRVVTPYVTGKAAVGASARARVHAKLCACCNVRRKFLKPVKVDRGTNAADSDETEDDDSLFDAESSDSSASESESDSVSSPGSADVDKPKSRRGRKPLPFRAWALCATCPAAKCFSCVYPTPESCGAGNEEARTSFLEAAAEKSKSTGACSSQGVKFGISDVPLWFCETCMLGRQPTFGTLPWCTACSGSLGGPPARAADDNAVLQPSEEAEEFEWPISLRCQFCLRGFHGACAAQAGIAALEHPKAIPAASDGKLTAAAIDSMDEDEDDEEIEEDPKEYSYVCWLCYWKQNPTGAAKMIPSGPPKDKHVFLCNPTSREIVVCKLPL